MVQVIKDGKPETPEEKMKRIGKVSGNPKPKKMEVAKTQEATPQALIQQGLESGASIEVMERMFNLQERWEKNQAKKAFDQAMSDFQSELPEIKKTKQVKDRNGKLLYSYAPIEQIVSQVKTGLSKVGLSYSIKTEMSKDEKGLTIGVKSTVVVKHIAGHSEFYEMEVPLGTKTDIMSQSQVIAAASTFSKRYAFSNAFGIMTADEDKEENLKPATQGEIEDAIAKLDHCMTLPHLKEVWSKLSKEQKANKDIIRHANEIKSNIENENSQNGAKE